jgi:ATP-binding cassette, subfamily B, bacterial
MQNDTDRPQLKWKDFLRVKPFLRPYRWPLLSMILLSLVASLLGLVQPYLSKYLVDEALLRQDMAKLQWAALLMFAATVAGVVLSFISGYGYMRVSSSMLFDMRFEVYRHLHTLSPRFYANARIGDLVSRLNGDVAEVQRISADSFLSSLSNVLFIFGSMGMMLWLSWKLYVVGVILVPLSVGLFQFYQVRITRLVRELRERSAEIGTLFVETLMGARLVAAFNASPYELGRFRTRNGSYVATLLRFQRTSLLGRTFPGTILTVATIAVFLYGGQQIILGEMTIGTLVAFMAYHAKLLSPIQNLLGLSASLSSARVSLSRVLELLDTPAEVKDNWRATALAPVRHSLELRNVTLRHGDRLVLDAVSLKIPVGRFSVVVGPSGSGKSTIADLFIRLLDPDSGSVLIDGVDIRTVRLVDLRRKVMLIEQSPHLMHGTLFWNISYPDPGVPRAQVEQAAHAAGLEELLARMPDGLDTIVGERGLTLSAGERQRVAIARAFLAKPEIVILDEPSAALDAAREVEVIENLRWRFSGKTLICITHKPHMTLTADHIVRIEPGRAAYVGVAV